MQALAPGPAALLVAARRAGSPGQLPMQFTGVERVWGRELLVDHLLILQYLLRHPELDTASASRICQRSETEAREILSEMEVEREYLERGETGRGTYWMLRPDLHRRLIADGHLERDRRIDWEAAKQGC